MAGVYESAHLRTHRVRVVQRKRRPMARGRDERRLPLAERRRERGVGRIGIAVEALRHVELRVAGKGIAKALGDRLAHQPGDVGVAVVDAPEEWAMDVALRPAPASKQCVDIALETGVVEVETTDEGFGLQPVLQSPWHFVR